MPCSVDVALQCDSSRAARLFDGARVKSEGEADARSTGALAGSCLALLWTLASNCRGTFFFVLPIF